MGKAEERKEPTFPLSYWNDAGDTDLGPLPDHLKRPEQGGEEVPPQPEAPPAKETQDLTLGQELQAKYPSGVTLRTDLEFEEFACYVDYVRQVRELRRVRKS